MERTCFFLLLVILLGSCREDFVAPPDADFEPSISLNAELSNNEVVEVRLHKTIEVGAALAEARLEEAAITFSALEDVKGDTSKSMNMIFDQQRKSYVLEDIFYRVEEGRNYQIQIVPEPATAPDKVITANTHIPKSVSASGFRIEDLESEEDADGNTIYRMTLFISLNKPVEFPAFFHLTPFRQRSELRENNDGTIGFQDFKIQYEVDVEEVIDSRNGVVTLVHKDGVFVDHSKIQNNEVKMVIQTASRPLDPQEVLRILNVDIATLTPELYYYNIALDKEIRSLQSNVGSVSNNFTNVENGIGIFGGLSKVTYPVILK